MADNDMLRAALLYAEQGIPVFPCAGKVPATPNGFKDASTDEAQLRAWFEHGDYNIAMRPADAGILVVDVDIGSDPAIKDQLPSTHTVRTPRGGYHFYYRTDLPIGNRDLAHKVNIRCANGYVLIPPSSGYMIIDSQDPAPLPRWVQDKLTIPDRPVPEVREGGEVISHKRLVEILSRISPACDYETWSRVIAACSTLTPDFDLDLPNVLLAWSSGMYFDGKGAFEAPENYCGDDFDMEAKLASFTRGNGATMGTLLYLAGMLDHDTSPLAPPDYSAESWAEMDIKAPTQLIGPLNDGSRVMIHAPTGIGKTHFAMALSASLAAGESFCHWSVPKAAKVLYIDGEMPPGLMKERVIEMMKRAGPLDRRLTLLSHSLFSKDEQLEPLNTQQGQDQVQAWLDLIRPDLVVFDNIVSLTAGDLKDTESWRGVQNWVKGFEFAQLWVHHSNKDGSAYGDKSREWQFDTVISLMPAESVEEEDLTFDLSFRKHRELHPGKNGSAYQEGRFTMRSNGWSFVPKQDIDGEAIEELLSDEGPMRVTAVAKALGLSRATANRLVRSKWSKFVVPGSKPMMLDIPQKTEDF